MSRRGDGVGEGIGRLQAKSKSVAMQAKSFLE
jgi:hypothetical protein